MIIVNVKKNGGIEKALKTYKYRLYKSEQTLEYMDNTEFTKPSSKKRKMRKKAEYSQKKRTENE